MEILKKNNSKLNLMLIFFNLFILFFVAIMLFDAEMKKIFDNITQINEIKSKITTKYNFFNYLFENGKSSYIAKLIYQTEFSKQHNSNQQNIIIAFLNNRGLNYSYINTNNVDTVNEVNSINIFKYFQKFNIFLQISCVCFYLSLGLFLISLFLIVKNFIFIFKQKNNYFLIKFFVYIFVNIPSLIVFKLFDLYFLKKKPDIFTNESNYLKNLKIFIILKKLEERFSKLNKNSCSEILKVENLYYSFSLKHNLFKHYLDTYKFIKMLKKIDENDHLFNINNLFFNKEKKYILKNVNFSIKKNSFNVILGPNGCGKTTLIKILINIYENFLGTISWYSQSLKEVNKYDLSKKISYIPQEIYMPSKLNIYDFLKYFSNNRDNCDFEVLKTLKESGIYKFKNTNIDELSGGQKQKILFSTILVKNSEIIVLDEPTIFFDIKNQNELLKSLKNLQKQNKTIIMILHDIEQALNYSDNIIIMNKGEIYKTGSPEEIIKTNFLKDVFLVNSKIIKNKNQYEILNVE